jgi:anti-anti-sigma regulatory factor
VRSVGGTRHASGFGAQDHLSWAYEDRADFRRRVCEFLSDGFDLGLRCIYAAEAPLERLESDLADLPDVQDHIRRGALTISVLSDLYPEDSSIDPGETLAIFSAATEEALAQGYAGLRIAADSTRLVRSPEQLAAFAEWEHMADRYMSEHPFSGLCAFDQSQLPASTTIALACLHPTAREGTTPFCVYSSGNEAHLALAGELDMAVTDDFRACLDRTRLDVTRELIVDGTGLDFVDHRALQTISDFARRFGATAVFRTCSSTPGRLIELLRLDGIRAVSVTTEGVA